jgi:phosphatidate cytidylyltransferase
MNETLRDLFPSCLCYFINILHPIFNRKFFILFGVFLLIATVEFCNLVHLNKVIPSYLQQLTYFYQITIATNGLLSQLRFNNTFDLTVLGFTLFVFLKCIHFLLIIKLSKLIPFQNIYLIGYVILPFVIMTKIPFGINGYNPKILISIFILIWTNDSFAYIVGKSIGKTKLFERISQRKL